MDEVCDDIYTTPYYWQLGQIADGAHSLGLGIVFIVSMPGWANELMDYCGNIKSPETWQGGAQAPLSSTSNLPCLQDLFGGLHETIQPVVS